MNYQELALQKAAEAFRQKFSRIDLTIEDLYVVWFCKTLRNWKALVSTDALDGAYLEVTHDGDSFLTYVDFYSKSTQAILVDEAF